MTPTTMIVNANAEGIARVARNGGALAAHVPPCRGRPPLGSQPDAKRNACPTAQRRATVGRKIPKAMAGISRNQNARQHEAAGRSMNVIDICRLRLGLFLNP